VNFPEDPATTTETSPQKPAAPPTETSFALPPATPEVQGLGPTPGPETPRPSVFPAQPPAELTFTCLLIPRFHNHHLVGDITTYLPEWLGQICISYGWRLEAIVVRPGYLHWIISTPLSVNPVQLMRLIRRRTSEKIFEDFPRFKQLNLSGDFWAPGYYINASNQLLSLEAISEFIQATRQQQGIF